MIIINKNADFSGCGLGKITFKVSNEVNKLLDSLYDNLDFKYKLIFQQFVDEIGGLNGDIYNSIHRLVIPAFASNAKECYTDVITKEVFSSGGGNYNKYADYITINKGVGAIFDGTSSDASNILNFNPLSGITDSLCYGVIINNSTIENTLFVAKETALYTNFWNIRYSSSINKQIYYPQYPCDCVMLNVKDNIQNTIAYANNIEVPIPTSIQEGFNLDYFKQAPASFVILRNGKIKVPLKMYFLANGLSAENAKKLSNAMWNFYNNLI